MKLQELFHKYYLKKIMCAQFWSLNQVMGFADILKHRLRFKETQVKFGISLRFMLLNENQNIFEFQGSLKKTTKNKKNLLKF